jgi:hypothetical protein
MATDSLGRTHPVLTVIITMAAILIVAAVVVVYVAFPHRNQDVPGAPWLGDALKRGVDALPTLDDELTRR